MPWIKSPTVLLRHRKLLRLAAELNLPPVYVLGHLHALWHTVLEQQEDGNLSDWTEEMLADAAAYTGDAGRFVAALQRCGFLDNHVIPDWDDYAGRYLTYKYKPRKTKNRRQSDQRRTTVGPPHQPHEAAKRKCAVPSMTAPVWAAYAAKYRERYGVDPVRNAKINGQLAQFLRRIPVADAPALAAWYVEHPNALYVRSQHVIGLLLRDAEGLYTQWKSGRWMTAAKAHEHDARSTRGDMWREIAEELQAERRTIHVTAEHLN